jgi:hypothetical protein
VKVAVLIVDGFIALLNVAVTTAVLGHTSVEPAGGVTDVTVGGATGLVGGSEATFLSGSPHPAAKMSNKSAAKQMLWILCVRMQTSSSRLSAVRRSTPTITTVNRDGCSQLHKFTTFFPEEGEQQGGSQSFAAR